MSEQCDFVGEYAREEWPGMTNRCALKMNHKGMHSAVPLQCCCHYGMAVSGEWPEFECFYCPVHKNAFDMADMTCKRHQKELDDLSTVNR